MRNHLGGTLTLTLTLTLTSTALVFLFVVLCMQSADDLAILSSIQILWSSGSNCMVITTVLHTNTTEMACTWCVRQREIIRVLFYYSFQ
jgi:hypothetical protein